MIKAIETRYAGCKFRSRLEARWAVFLDNLSIRWEYEPQGYELDSGRYLPDFWLPDAGCWLEIKGQEPVDADRVKILELAQAVCADGQRVRVLTGDVPRQVQLYDGRIPVLPAGIVIPGWMSLPIENIEQYASVPAADWIIKPAYWQPAGGVTPTRVDLNAALSAARSARFEYGHSGAA